MVLFRPIGIVLIAVVLAGCQSMAPAATAAGPAAATPGGTSVASPDDSGSGALSGSPVASAPPLPSAPAVKILIDTDVAPDDLVAISFLVAAPNVEIVAITVSGTGEVHCPRGVSIVLGLLERLHAPDIPVACGSDRPIALDHAFPALFRDNADAAAGLDLPTTERSGASGDAVALITTTAASGAGRLRILTLGPLTNLAQAIAATPSLAEGLESVYVMGGAVDVAGNVAGSPEAPANNTTAEWNIYVDPAAAAAVLDSGSPVRFVSLDGTNQVPVTQAFGGRVTTAASGAALAVLAELFAKNDYMTSGGYYLWDAVAAITAAGYPVGDFTDARLSVDTTDGPASGRTLRADGPANAAYMTRADAATIEGLIIGVMNGN
jgi:inosine-uridine nucleoside N-ribohydrolase